MKTKTSKFTRFAKAVKAEKNAIIFFGIAFLIIVAMIVAHPESLLPQKAEATDTATKIEMCDCTCDHCAQYNKAKYGSDGFDEYMMLRQMRMVPTLPGCQMFNMMLPR